MKLRKKIARPSEKFFLKMKAQKINGLRNHEKRRENKIIKTAGQTLFREKAFF